jgi:2-oxo-3-hexenedioate decarboxylase
VIDVDLLAARLLEAADTRQTIEPLTTSLPSFDVEAGYAVQDALVARLVARGERVVGAKLGLTSKAKQVEMGVHEPIGAWLTDAMVLAPGSPIEVASLGQPRVEPEIAFRMARDLAGEDVTADHVLAATEAVMPAIEVLDSRYRDYRFTLADVVADNASAARFIVGDPVSPAGLPLELVGVVFEMNGDLVSTAAGAAVMGHPAAAVAWWVRRLAGGGRGLRAGDLVLSGALTGAVPVRAGDIAQVSIDRLGSVRAWCA